MVEAGQLEARFPYLPDFFEEESVMAHLYGYFDESGKHADSRVVSFGGFIDGFDKWRAFTGRWVQLLREHQISEFRAAKALRHSQPFGNFPKCTAEERAAQIEPFIREIAGGLSLAVSIAVDVRAYRRVKELHREFSTDPHYFAFFCMLSLILQYFGIPKAHTIGLIFDDEQRTAVRCYRLLSKLKARIPEVRQLITSICFSDDKDTPQVQAADLFAYLSRAEAARIFTDKPHPYQSLFTSFGQVMANGQHLCMHAQFFSEDALRAFVKEQKCTIVFAHRVRLPGG